MRAEIKGAAIPTLEVWLERGDYVVSAHGDLAWMTSGVELAQVSAADSRKPARPGRRGRPGRGGRRKEPPAAAAALTRYSGPGTVTFAAKMPGQIMPVDVVPGVSYRAPAGGWLCATAGVAASVVDGGLALVKLEGEGRAWVEFGGDITSYELPVGQTILAGPGHVGMFEGTVEFALTRIRGGAEGGPGGDGPHLLALTGPGRIWLRSMPVPVLAHALRPFLIPREAGSGSRAAAPRRAGG